VESLLAALNLSPSAAVVVLIFIGGVITTWILASIRSTVKNQFASIDSRLESIETAEINAARSRKEIHETLKTHGERIARLEGFHDKEK